MPVFQYEGAYRGGQHVTGVVNAVSKNEAATQIRQKCDVIISLTEIKEKKDFSERFRKIDSKGLSLTCGQFAIILKAGLPLVQAVDLAAGQTADKAMENLLRQVAQDISNGWSMSYSFSQRGTKLPVTFQETVRAGEESGDLIHSFERMRDYYDRMYKTKQKASSALLYPSFVMAVAIIVIGIIMVYAVPTFTTMFGSLNVELPMVTKALIGLSNFMSRYIWAIIALAAAVLLGIRLYGHTENGGPRLAKWKLSLPIIGKINQMAGASQFAHTMSTMLAAGMPIIQAIEVSGRAMSNQCMSQEILSAVPGVEAGKPLGECLQTAPNLPPMLVQMTAIGEATGALESTLEVLAEYYDNEVDTQTTRALSLLEPIIICGLAVFVVFILMAVYLPMFSMYSAI